MLKTLKNFVYNLYKYIPYMYTYPQIYYQWYIIHLIKSIQMKRQTK